MQKLIEVLAMGGYGPYVWPSFLIAGAIMLGMVIVSLRSLKRARNALAKLHHEA